MGGAIARIALSGAYLNYVKSGMKPYLLVSAAVLLALGAMALVDALRKPERHLATLPSMPTTRVGLRAPSMLRRPEAIDVTGHNDGHDHGSMRAAWLLLPVAAIFLIAPGPWVPTPRHDRRRVSPHRVRASNSIRCPPGIPWPSAGRFRDASHLGRRQDARGRTVDLVGFVTPTSDGQWQLTRMSLTCCAADAVTVKVQPKGDVAPLPANAWVTVTGTYEPGGGTQSSTAIPWVKVKEVTKIQQPADRTSSRRSGALRTAPEDLHSGSHRCSRARWPPVRPTSPRRGGYLNGGAAGSADQVVMVAAGASTVACLTVFADNRVDRPEAASAAIVRYTVVSPTFSPPRSEHLVPLLCAAEVVAGLERCQHCGSLSGGPHPANGRDVSPPAVTTALRALRRRRAPRPGPTIRTPPARLSRSRARVERHVEREHQSAHRRHQTDQ